MGRTSLSAHDQINTSEDGSHLSLWDFAESLGRGEKLATDASPRPKQDDGSQSNARTCEGQRAELDKWKAVDGLLPCQAWQNL